MCRRLEKRPNRRVFCRRASPLPSYMRTRWSGMASREVAQIVARVAHVGLIHARPQKAPQAEVSKKPGAVMILEPDIEGFQRPLTQLLQNRAEPLSLLPFEQGQDIFATIVKERPKMVILNADVARDAAIRAVAQVRKAEDLSHLAVVAVLDTPNQVKIDELSAAGFDSVLTKPVTYVDLERLLVA